MAKGSQTGVIKGKRGNVVFYKIGNSNNKEKQGSREYVADVANPMTIPQAVQRVKLTPALRFYSAFKEILNHSWEGVKYGGESYRFFLKRAMNLLSGYPFALKGLATALPGQYQVSEGSVPSIKYEFDSDGNLVCEVLSLDAGDSFGDWSQLVIDASHGALQTGDQITIMRMIGDDIRYNWTNTIRFVLDTTSTELASTKFGLLGLSISPDGVITTSAGDDTTFGAAIIVSRPVISQTSGTVEWKRSTQFFLVNYAEPSVAAYFTQDSYNAAVRSYTKSSIRDIQSAWFLNQGKAKVASAGAIPDAPVSIPFQMGVTAQVRDTDSWLYGVWLATLRDTNGKTYLIADPVVSNMVTAYGYAANGNTDVVSNNLYAVNTTISSRLETDAAWVALKAEYDGVLTPNEATAIAAANGVTLTFTTGA